ncbi:hypothetical protein [Candidatus Vidania fulgoroideorum]
MSKKTNKAITIPYKFSVFNCFVLLNCLKLKIINKYYYYFIIKKQLSIFPKKINNFTKKCFGTYFSLINNFFYGIKKKYRKKIILKGIEYKVCVTKPDLLCFMLGFSHNITINIPKNVCVNLNKKVITATSYNNVILGNFCNKILKLKKYNLYKDKGIKFFNEKKLLKERKKK